MDAPSDQTNAPLNNPQVAQPVGPVVTTANPSPPVQTPNPPSQNMTSPPPVVQNQPTVNTTTSEPKKSKFKIFLVFSIILIVIIWGSVAFLYFKG